MVPALGTVRPAAVLPDGAVGVSIVIGTVTANRSSDEPLEPTSFTGNYSVMSTHGVLGVKTIKTKEDTICSNR